MVLELVLIALNDLELGKDLLKSFYIVTPNSFEEMNDFVIHSSKMYLANTNCKIWYKCGHVLRQP